MFAVSLAERYYHLGMRQQTQTLLDAIWESSCDANARMLACALKGELSHNMDDYSGSKEWTKRGIDIAIESGNEKSCEMEDLYFSLCGWYLSVQKLEEAESVLRKIEELPGSKHAFFFSSGFSVLRAGCPFAGEKKDMA